MKIRSGFVSNSSSSSFIIKFDKEKDVTIKMPLSTLLRFFDADIWYGISGNREFTEEDIKEKEYPYRWKIDNNIVQGRFRHGGDGPNQMEILIQELYGKVENLFDENNIEYGNSWTIENLDEE